MSLLEPRELLALVPGVEVAPDVRPASGITFDSRAADPQTAFAALPGETTHGNRFIADALGRGTPFVLADTAAPRAVRVPEPVAVLRRWARARRDASGATVVGVSGTAGKTTAKEYAAAALGAGRGPGTHNTLNALACHLLSRLEEAPTHVLELGIDRPGEMAELVALVNPDLGVVTSVGPAHLERLGTVENVAREKGVLLAGRRGLVGEGAAAHYPERESYGFAPGLTHRGEDLTAGPDGVAYRYRGLAVRLPSPSAKIAEASLLGLVLAERFGVDMGAALERMRTVEVPGGRMRVERGRLTLLDDAYNANPLSVGAALETLARFPGRRVAVLGDMLELGPQAEHFHGELGRRAGRVAHLVLAVGAHGPALAAAAREGGAETLAFETAAEAAREVGRLVEPGDTVLVKGSNSVGLGVVAEAVRERL